MASADSGKEREANFLRFYRYFDEQLRVLNGELQEFNTMETNKPDRNQGLDRLAKEIQRVQEEVQDASSYTPDHDQRTYAQGLKDFKEKLQKARAAGSTRSKFSFKSGRKIASATPAAGSFLNPIGNGDDTTPTQTPTPTLTPTPTPSNSGYTASPTQDTYNAELRKPSDLKIRSTSFSKAESILLEDHSYIHIIFPGSTPSGGTGVLTKLKHCIINLSHPGMHGGTARLPNLNIRDVQDSLLVTGTVHGATHITAATNSVILVATQQLRMHDCKDVDIYLTCASHPIIENCSRIRFAPLPAAYAHFATSLSDSHAISNQWDQVDDFNWLKQEPSPNWSILPESERVSEETWRDVVPGSDKHGLTDILTAVGVRDAEMGRSRRGSETCGGDGF